MEWRDVVGFEGLYKVSSNGDIASLDKPKIHPKGSEYIKKGIMLKLSTDKDGYKVVSLRKNLTIKMLKVHRMVAQAFILNTLNKKTVNHIDGNKTNNLASNLEWNTHRENTIHRSSFKNKTSKYSNIHLCNTTKKWIAQVQMGNFKKMIGAFSSEDIAYNKLNEYKTFYGIQ